MKKLSEILLLNEQGDYDNVEHYMGHLGMEIINDCDEKISHMVSQLNDVFDRIRKEYMQTHNEKQYSQLRALHMAAQDLRNANGILHDFQKEYWSKNGGE